MSTLLIDFGASRVKAGICHADETDVTDIKIYAPCPPVVSDKGRYEVDASGLAGLFTRIVEEYTFSHCISSVFMCSEMHGFALADRNNRPLTDYISWKDERDAQSGGTFFHSLTSFITPSDYLALTGMACTTTVPVVNLCQILKNLKLREAKVLSLPELIVAIAGHPTDTAHVTLSAGIGFYDIGHQTVSDRMVEFIRRETGTTVSMNALVHNKLEPMGTIKGITVYTGVGDLQAALYGADNDESTVSLNLGTGSQVSCVGCSIPSFELETRPFFDGKDIRTITHIPSGRMLNAYVGFLNSINPREDFWKQLSEITSDEIQDAPLDFGLGIFKGAWGGDDGGYILRISEGNLTVRGYLASLLNAYINQYVRALSKFGDLSSRTVVLSGGIPGKLPVIGQIIGNETGLTVRHSSSREETLDGLAKLANAL